MQKDTINQKPIIKKDTLSKYFIDSGTTALNKLIVCKQFIKLMIDFSPATSAALRQFIQFIQTSGRDCPELKC